MIPYLLAIAGGYLIGTSNKVNIMKKGGIVVYNADDWKVGYEMYSGKKLYFLYNEKTGKIQGFYETKAEAEKKLSSYAKGGRICPVGTEVQTLIFDKDVFSEKEAKSWAKKHNMKYGYVDEKENTYRIRQEEPSEFKDESFRTINITEGVKAVIGCPRNKIR